MSKNSERIFRGGLHRMTAPFLQKRSGGRVHKGTDYGTYQKAILQYPPLDSGIVNSVTTVEQTGKERGLMVDIHYKELDIGIILQHATKVFVKKGQLVDRDTPVISTGMTGKDSKGNKVSTGIHAHVEVYNISTTKRLDFEKINFEELEEKMAEITYKTINDVPVWGRPAIQKMIDLGGITPTNGVIDITHSMLRIYVSFYKINKNFNK